MSRVTQKSIEVWLHNKRRKIYLSSPFGIFCLHVILTISYLPAQTIETSSLPTDSSRPMFEQIEIFSSILTGSKITLDEQCCQTADVQPVCINLKRTDGKLLLLEISKSLKN